MEPSAGNDTQHVRLLGLGNGLLADDAFGLLVACEAERILPEEIEVVCSSDAGYSLMDHLLGASSLIVVDTIVTGAARPGTVHVFDLDQLKMAPCVAPHFLGLREVLAAGRQLHLNVPNQAVVIAVEAADCTTIGGAMHPDVRTAIAEAVGLVRSFVADGYLKCVTA